MVENAGIKEVKRSLSRYIRKVKMGETITITERGVPVARLSPVHVRVPEGALKMVDEGLAFWQGSRPGQIKPIRKKGAKGKDLSEMVSEERR
ncbi:MAG: type II toxin-antitoxin system prevent-host-death family antitoxin [Bacillota bacterium]|nr:type II toxin-antitoxin system prevent-host-death family antitoxin [Bacillota bacterium]